MDGQAIIIVSGAVVALSQLVKGSDLAKRHALLVVFTLSAVGVGLWGWSAEAFTRASAFEFFIGWVAVATSAAGVFGIVRATPDAVAAFKK